MATTGAKFPATVTTLSEAPWSDNDWTTPGNISADDTAYASVTAATFDTNDQTFKLRATGFDFAVIPDGSSIDGIIVVCGQCRYANGSGSIDLVRLVDNGTEVGDNKRATAVALTTTDADYTQGSSTDTWAATLTPALVKTGTFGVNVGMLSTAANTDVFIEFLTMEVFYTAPQNIAPGLLDDGTDTFYSPTVTPGPVDVAPALLNDGTDTFFGPTVTASNTVTPALLNESTDTFFAPAVTANNSVTPALLDGSANTFFGQTVSPGPVNVAPATLSSGNIFFAPAVSASNSMGIPLLDSGNIFFGPTVALITDAPPEVVGGGGAGGPGTWIGTDYKRLLSKLRAKRELLNVSQKQEKIIKKAVKKAIKKIDEAVAQEAPQIKLSPALIEQYAKAGFKDAGISFGSEHKDFIKEIIGLEVKAKQKTKAAEARRKIVARELAKRKAREQDIAYIMLMIA